LIIVRATGNSSHDALKMNIDTTAIAGSARGTISPTRLEGFAHRQVGTTPRTPWDRLEETRKRKIVNGKLDATYNSTRPVNESSK